jgi:hypothetical protein
MKITTITMTPAGMPFGVSIWSFMFDAFQIAAKNGAITGYAIA